MAQYRERVMPMGSISLLELKAGEEATVTSVDLEEPQKHRLEELGIVPGSRICVVHIAPSGSPTAYYIKGTVVALRSTDTNMIQVNMNEVC